MGVPLVHEDPRATFWRRCHRQGARLLWRMRVAVLFDDVLPLIAKVEERIGQGQTQNVLESGDLKDMPEIDRLLATQSKSLEYTEALPLLRKSVAAALIRFERRLLIAMGSIHFVDVLMSLLGALCSMAILRLFELPPSSAWFAYRVPVAVGLGILVFLLNVGSSALHARKIDWEMLLAYRIKTTLTRFLFTHAMRIAPEGRNKIATGEIVGYATQDAKHMGHFYAHGYVDLYVLAGSSAVLLVAMVWLFGLAAFVGFAVLLLHVPLVVWFARLSKRQEEALMAQTSRRLGLVTEWIQGMRIVRYFGWSGAFVKKIFELSTGEFARLKRIDIQFAAAFAIAMAWWMFVAVAILGAMYWQTGQMPLVSATFGVIWLSARLGTLLNPLPWFVSEYAMAKVSDGRLVRFFSGSTLAEAMQEKAPEFEVESNSGGTDDVAPDWWSQVVGVGFRVRGLVMHFPGSSGASLQIAELDIVPGRSMAIVGEVGSGKTLLENVLMGELLPTSGTVDLVICCKDVALDSAMFERIVPVYSTEGLRFVRSHVAFVPQASAVLSASVRENVTLRLASPDSDGNNSSDANDESSDYELGLIRGALERASLEQDLRAFPQGLATLIGERGINLSGGQKQRLSLSRAHYMERAVVIFDDPLSAVDRDTEAKLLDSIFSERLDEQTTRNTSKCSQTLIISTHRLGCVTLCDDAVLLDQGAVVVFGPTAILLNTDSPLNRWMSAHAK
jgi:ABC-type multidrug transport system fused ATPase/permease subunit